MLLHVNYITAPSDIVIRTVGTDVLIIALGDMDQFDPRKVLLLEAGVQGKNTLRYISIKKIFQNIGKKLSRSLLALHALTGYDYTASFSTKGKLRPLKHLWKNETSQETFSCLGDVEEIDESMLNVCEEFVCLLYNGKKVKLVNELCFDMFLTKYKTTDEQHLNEVKKMDASSLPPCQRVLRVKIARTRYICRIWRSSIFSSPPTAPTTKTSGWNLEDNQYKIKWFDGDLAPKAIDISTSKEGNDDYLECDINDSGISFKIL